MNIKATEHILPAKSKRSNGIFIIPSEPKNIPSPIKAKSIGIPILLDTLFIAIQTKIIIDINKRYLFKM